MDALGTEFPTAGVTTYVFIPPLVAFCISLFTSMAGISGAFLLLPFQLSVLGFASPSVNATNFLYNVVGTPGGIYRYAREGRLAWGVALSILVGVVPGVLLGYYLRVTLLPEPATFKFFVGAVLLYVGVRLGWQAMVRSPRSRRRTDEEIGSARVANTTIAFAETSFDFMGATYQFKTLALLGLAFAVSTVGGAFGIGGGAILAPLCVSFFGLPIRAIAGAVLTGTFVASLAGVLFYSLVPIQGTVWPPDWALGTLFGLGGLLGSYSGARLQKHMPEKAIKLILAGIVTTVAIRYIVQYLS